MPTSSLYNRLVGEKDRLSKFVLRTPKSGKELLDRKRWDRVMSILMRRYEYGMVDVMEEYRYGDFRDEIASVKK